MSTLILFVKGSGADVPASSNILHIREMSIRIDLSQPLGWVTVMQGEGQALITALSIALSNSKVAWPAFVPVHDALRDAVAGIAAVGRQSVILHADGMPAIRTAKQPPALLQVLSAERTSQSLAGQC